MQALLSKFKIIFPLLILCNLSFSQRDDLKFFHLSTQDGLSNSETNAIVQDKDGFIWIATSDGLNRYDGRKIKTYRNIISDTTSLSNNNVRVLFVDSRGILWVGTDRAGVCRYIKEKDCFVRYGPIPNNINSLYTDQVLAITEDNEYRIWIATYGGLNLFDFNKNNFIIFDDNPVVTITDSDIQKLKKQITYKKYIELIERFKNQKIKLNKLYYEFGAINQDSLQLSYDYLIAACNIKGIANSDIRTITCDTEGNIWIGYGGGFISRLNTKTMEFLNYKPIPSPSGNGQLIITSICAINNKLWVSTKGKGVWIIDTHTLESSRFEKLNELFTNIVFKDKEGLIWIGGDECGLVRYNSVDNSLTINKYNELDKFSLSSNNVTCVYEDIQNNIWVGGYQCDLNYTKKNNPFRSIKHGVDSNGILSSTNVSSILEEDNILWVGFYNVGGIDIINRKSKQKRHLVPNGNSLTTLGEGSVNCIFKDSRSNIWVGTDRGGLQLFNDKTGQFVTYRNNPKNNNSISGNNVRKIVEDKDGNLWIALHGFGVEKFNPFTKAFRHYKIDYGNKQNTILSNWVISLICDNENRIWVGTIEGISCIDNKKGQIRNYSSNPKDDKSLSSNFAWSLYQDSKGRIWVGTSNGLNLFEPKTGTFKKIAKKDGLPNDNISGILEDSTDNLWLATFKGLSRYSPKTNTFRNFDLQDGLATDEFMLSTGFKNKMGEMFFGGKDGIVNFSPDDIKDNQFVPPVYFTDFKLFNQSVEFVSQSKKGALLTGQMAYTSHITLKYSQNVFTFEFTALNFIRPEKNTYSYMMEGFDEQWNYIGNKNDVTYTNLPPGDYNFKVKAANNDGKWNESGTSMKLTIMPPWWKTWWAYLIYSILLFLIIRFIRTSYLQREKLKRKIELERMEAQKAREVDLMKLRFITNISHEFRTPLTLILAPLEKPFRLLSPDKLDITYSLISRNANRLLRLINQLMDIRKLEAGGLKLEASQNDVVAFVKEIAQMFNYEAQERNIKFSIIAEPVNIQLWFDADKLDKTIYNLLSNAFKFTPNGKRITVYLTVITIDKKEENEPVEYVQIIVEDTGMGITPDELSRIFDQFYQANTPQRNMGTGIGLALAKELIELHKGEISVKSTPNRETQFILLLPVGKEHLNNYQIFEKKNIDILNPDYFNINDKQSSEILIEEESERSKKLPLLLIIEDNPDLRLFIKHEFSHAFNVIEADNGIEGLEKSYETIPDIIISDIMMPGMDGVEVCQKLKSDERTSHIPVVLLTARSSEQHVIQGLETGADDYIAKPFHVSVLKARINNLIQSRKLLRKQFSKLPDISEAITFNSLDQKFLERAIKTVDTELQNSRFDTQHFSETMGLSRSQLYRKLQALTGCSVNEFIRNIRLKKAAEFLINTDHNVSEISDLVGFNEISYFVKCFSDYYGMPPTKFRSIQKAQKQ